MRNKGVVFVVIGAVLILSALSLYLYNRKEDDHAGQESQTLMSELREINPTKPEIDTSPEISVTSPHATAQTAQPPQDQDSTLTEVELNGYLFIGYISVPVIELELPVMSEWGYDRLKIAPCRQFGSSKSNDLVIAAHNYENHFGALKTLVEGDTVIFTDMDGNVNRYTVKRTDTINPTDVEAVQNSGYDLVLYTCTKGGQTRVTVFCDRSEEPTVLPALQQ